MERLIKTLIELLVHKGMELTSIPAFIRSLAHTLASDPGLTLEELNARIHLLGWSDFELDCYTLHLVLAAFETDWSSRSLRRNGFIGIPLKADGRNDGGGSIHTYPVDHHRGVPNN